MPAKDCFLLADTWPPHWQVWTATLHRREVKRGEIKLQGYSRASPAFALTKRFLTRGMGIFCSNKQLWSAQQKGQVLRPRLRGKSNPPRLLFLCLHWQDSVGPWSHPGSVPLRCHCSLLRQLGSYLGKIILRLGKLLATFIEKQITKIIYKEKKNTKSLKYFEKNWIPGTVFLFFWSSLSFSENLLEAFGTVLVHRQSTRKKIFSPASSMFEGELLRIVWLGDY